jgi:hypothetical protein
VGRVFEEKANVKTKNPNPKYQWLVFTERDFRLLSNYFKRHPCKSKKRLRLRLVNIYFHYKKLKYHLMVKNKPHSAEAKQWAKFCKLWYKYSF